MQQPPDPKDVGGASSLPHRGGVHRTEVPVEVVVPLTMAVILTRVTVFEFGPQILTRVTVDGEACMPGLLWRS
jgi:hypothetical protein